MTHQTRPFTKPFVKKVIRLHRRDSAFAYAILESLDGMTSFSTLPDTPGQDFRELELRISPDFVTEVDDVLKGMRKKFPIIEIHKEE